MVTDTTFTEITLEWTAVPDAETYILSRSPRHDDPVSIMDLTSFTFTGLVPGTAYTFSIFSSRADVIFDSEAVTLNNATGKCNPTSNH